MNIRDKITTTAVATITVDDKTVTVTYNSTDINTIIPYGSKEAAWAAMEVIVDEGVRSYRATNSDAKIISRGHPDLGGVKMHYDDLNEANRIRNKYE